LNTEQNKLKWNTTNLDHEGLYHTVPNLSKNPRAFWHLVQVWNRMVYDQKLRNIFTGLFIPAISLLHLSQFTLNEIRLQQHRFGYTCFSPAAQLCNIPKQKHENYCNRFLRHISMPLTQELVQKGHAVTVISSKPENKKTLKL